MAQRYDDVSFSIGRTPLIRLNKIIGDSQATVLAKIEGRNPAYSVKCRIGAAMVWDAEKSGALKTGMTLVEPTSGNTGIALAAVTAARGYRLVLTMPDTMSIERRKLLKIFGAHLVLTEGALGMRGAVEKAEKIIADNPETHLLLQQFENPANPRIHEMTTGPEIWRDTDGGIDVLISGVGTGGTISGISHYIKNEKKKNITSIAVEPENSPVIQQRLNNERPKPGPHKIQGIGAGFIPGNLDLSIVDGVELVSNEEAFEYSRRLAREEGLLSGISSGAAVAVAARLAKRPQYAGKTIVAILPDGGERYLSTALYDGLFDKDSGI